MAIDIELTIKLISDFHLGTGTGRGRATDAVVLVDQLGVPYISGSTIKGLCRWHAFRLIDAYPHFGPKPTEDEIRRGNTKGAAFELFGGSTELAFDEDRVWFDHAYAKPGKKVALMRTGRSARERNSGRANDGSLFFYEDAGPGEFITHLRSDHPLSSTALLLLLLSLRRIDAIGGQRRRGKGRCESTIQVIRCDTAKVLEGLKLPAEDESDPKRFLRFAEPLLNPNPKSRSIETHSQVESPSISLGGIERDVRESADVPSTLQHTLIPTGVSSGSLSCWLVFAIAKSPLTLGHEQSIENAMATQDFISGSSFRGALAWQAIRDGLDSNSSFFQDAFVREKICFGPLYPAAEFWKSSALSMPSVLPASIYTCKRFPGTIYDASSTAHGIVDQIHAQQDECQNDQCKLPLKPAERFVQFAGDTLAANPIVYLPQQRVFLRTAIDEETQRGADEQLFGLESLEGGTRFGGFVWGDQATLEQLFASRRDAWTTLRVGKARTRGQGLLEIRIVPTSGDSHACYPNLLASSARVSANPTSSSVASSAIADGTFYVTLYSDVIAIDSLLRPITQMSGQHLWSLVGGTGDPPFKLMNGYATSRRIGGFLGFPGLPRTPDVAIAAGSTWKFQWLDNISQAAIDAAKKHLGTAEGTGIGLRRGEGFGRFILNHPLHEAKWTDQLRISHPMKLAQIAFPGIDAVSPRSADRSPYRRNHTLAANLSDGDNWISVRRLLAEWSQSESPLDELQKCFDNPLMRPSKVSELKDLILKLAQEQSLSFRLYSQDHKKWLASDAAKDAIKTKEFRLALKQYCGDFHHE